MSNSAVEVVSPPTDGSPDPPAPAPCESPDLRAEVIRVTRELAATQPAAEAEAASPVSWAARTGAMWLFIVLWGLMVWCLGRIAQ
jgi:hypothetical protein